MIFEYFTLFIVVDTKVVDMKEYSFIPQIFIEGLGAGHPGEAYLPGGVTDNK